MPELFDDEFRRVLINRLVLRRHDAVVHQSFNDVADLFGHPVGQFSDGDRLWQLNVTHNLFTRLRGAHRFLTRTLLLALHSSH